MQCSVCNYEFTMREQQSATPCPRCEAAKAKPLQVAQSAPPAGVAPHVKKVMADYQGAQPVVIMDLNMSFNSMVWFMVKWVIASIPAMIILVALFFLISVFFGGLFAGLKS